MAGGFGFVERVEVEAIDVGGEEFAALARGPVDAVTQDGFGIVGDRVEFDVHLFGDGRAAHGGEFLDLGDVGDGHDAGDDGHGDADVAAAIHEAEEMGVVEIELGDDEIGAGIDLGLQAFEIGVEVGRLGMFLGITGASEAEFFREMFAEVTDEVDGVLEIGEPAFGWVGQVGGSVAAQGEDVFDAVGGEVFEDAVDVVQRLADAGEMGHRLELELFLDLERDLQRAGAGAATSAIGARGKGWAQLVQARERVEEIGHRLVGLRGKELERDRRPRGLEDVADFHGVACRAAVTIRQYVLNAIRASSRRWAGSKSGAGLPGFGLTFTNFGRQALCSAGEPHRSKLPREIPGPILIRLLALIIHGVVGHPKRAGRAIGGHRELDMA